MKSVAGNSVKSLCNKQSSFDGTKVTLLNEFENDTN